LTGIITKAMNDAAINAMPPTVNGRAPKRSASHPAIGAAAKKPNVAGNR
jgi:hypothetical protein